MCQYGQDVSPLRGSPASAAGRPGWGRRTPRSVRASRPRHGRYPRARPGTAGAVAHEREHVPEPGGGRRGRPGRRQLGGAQRGSARLGPGIAERFDPDGTGRGHGGQRDEQARVGLPVASAARAAADALIREFPSS